MSLPREHFKESLFCEDIEGEDIIFSERSKSQEHTDRFTVSEDFQKLKKNEEN